MKTNRMSFMAATLAVGTMATVALGAGEKIKVIETDLWGAGGGGGPFEVEPIGFPTNPQGVGLHGAGAGNFVTFCVETDEFLSEGGVYFIQFNDAAEAGGSGGPSPDPLSDATRYLYAHFIRGTIQAELDAWDAHVGPTETFTYGAFADGEALQKAIWHLEEETGGSNNFLVGLATWALANGTLSDLSEISKVRVMNMWDNANFTGNRQDLLVMIPLPAPVWMGGVGLCGVIGLAFRQRRRSRQHGADLAV
ncbi:MAG: hypothetical protein IT430_07975 [Phycisphaerales bacterium]|nr:hypothetical protein [Phycisphaerales bacterium]